MWSFLKKRATKPQGMVGISINQNGIICTYVIPGAGKPEVKHYEFLACLGIEGCSSAIKNYVEKYQLQGADCTYVLQPTDYRLILIDTPTVAGEKELREAARWAAMDFIDFPLEEAGIDIFESPIHSGRKSKTYVVITRVSLLQEIAKVIRDANLHLVRIDITELALCNAIATLYNNHDGWVLLYLVRNNIHVLISKEKMLYLERNIDIGSLLGDGQHTEEMDATSKIMSEVKKNHESISTEEPMTTESPHSEAMATKTADELTDETASQARKSDVEQEQEYLVVDTDVPDVSNGQVTAEVQEIKPVASDKFFAENEEHTKTQETKTKPVKKPEMPKLSEKKVALPIPEVKSIEIPKKKVDQPAQEVKPVEIPKKIPPATEALQTQTPEKERGGLMSELIATKLRQSETKKNVGGES